MILIHLLYLYLFSRLNAIFRSVKKYSYNDLEHFKHPMPSDSIVFDSNLKHNHCIRKIHYQSVILVWAQEFQVYFK